MARPTVRADEVRAGQYILDDGVLHLVVFVWPLDVDVLFVFANGWTVTRRDSWPIQIPSAEEIDEAELLAHASGRGVRNFPRNPGFGVGETRAQRQSRILPGEFGPESTVEHGDMTGAFPVVEPRHCADCYPSGFSPGTYEGPKQDCPVHGENADPLRYQRSDTDQSVDTPAGVDGQSLGRGAKP